MIVVFGHRIERTGLKLFPRLCVCAALLERQAARLGRRVHVGGAENRTRGACACACGGAGTGAGPLQSARVRAHARFASPRSSRLALVRSARVDGRVEKDDDDGRAMETPRLVAAGQPLIPGGNNTHLHLDTHTHTHTRRVPDFSSFFCFYSEPTGRGGTHVVVRPASGLPCLVLCDACLRACARALCVSAASRCLFSLTYPTLQVVFLSPHFGRPVEGLFGAGRTMNVRRSTRCWTVGRLAHEKKIRVGEGDEEL